MALPLEFSCNPSISDVRAQLERILSSSRASLRVGAVEKSGNNIILAEVIDNHNKLVLKVEVDGKTGYTLRAS